LYFNYRKNTSKLDFIQELNNKLSVVRDWLIENKIGATNEKTETIVWEIFRYVVKHGVESDIQLIKEKLKQTPCVIGEGNLWEYLLEYFDSNTRIVAFCQDISELTPCGLNTSPNACCGKFELLYRLLRPNSSQPKKGDIVDNGEICEIKGSEVRISDTELIGIEYKKNCSRIFEGHIVGNIVKTGGLKGSGVYEIEKKQYKNHYQFEFAKDIHLSKKLIREYFNDNGWQCDDGEIECIFENNDWNQDTMNKIITRKMYMKYKQKMGFDKMFIFGNGTNVKIISGPNDLSKIQITTDYFRINQTGNVGWYIE
jgi:hypothetical protein